MVATVMVAGAARPAWTVGGLLEERGGPIVAGAARPAWTVGGLLWERGGSSGELPADHVHRAKRRDEVRDHLALDHPVERRHRRQARRGAAHPGRGGAAGRHHGDSATRRRP